MEHYSIPDVLSSEIFEHVLTESPFANRAERIRKTLLELHHQYLELKLIGQSTGPDVDITLLEETAYWLSGVSTTPVRENTFSKKLKDEMLAVSALIFEYLGDTSRATTEPQNLDNYQLYYLDASICNSLSIFEANSIALSKKYLQDPDELSKKIDSDNEILTEKDCLNLVYIWLAREMSFIWIRRKKIEEIIARTYKNLNQKLLEGNIARSSFSALNYWLTLMEATISHSRYFQFGKVSYIDTSNDRFTKAISLVRSLGNPPLIWTTVALKKCAESMIRNSIWNRLENIFSQRYIRRLATSNPPILELWSSQLAALDIKLEAQDGSETQLQNGYLDNRINRVAIGMPTTSGKTLLAELAIVKTLFPLAEMKRPEQATTCIYVVPTIALANQIEQKLSSRLLPLGIRATAVVGGYDSAFLDDTIFNKTKVGIITPEKLDMLVRQDHPFIKNCKLYIFDEVHKLDNGSRGFTMEMIITWLKEYHQDASKAKMLFISAMMPNRLEFNAWISNKQNITNQLPALSLNLDWRPTRQIKGIVQVDKNDLIERKDVILGSRTNRVEYWFGAHLTYVNEKADLANPRQIRRLIKFKEVRTTKNEKDSKNSYGVEETAAELAKKYFQANFIPILVFFYSRDETKNFCDHLSNEDFSPKDLDSREKEQYDEFISFVEERLGDKHPLASFIKKGIAYHHGWLPKDIRAEIEYAFSKKWLRIIASTTTLIDGVNFPISTFILANHEKIISVDNVTKEKIFSRLGKKDFQNMIGRAGRAVYETEGQIVFLTPFSNYPGQSNWQDYIFQDQEASESQIVSSLVDDDFNFDILSQMLDALEKTINDTQSLRIDIDEMESRLGNGAREVGEIILRLQAFLLALMDREILNTDSFDTFLKFLNQTLFGLQNKEQVRLETLAKFMFTTGKGIAVAEPNRQKRSTYSKTGLGFYSCKEVYQTATRFWETYGKSHYTENIQHLSETFLEEVGSSLFDLQESRPEPIKIPHKKPNRFIPLPHGEILTEWVLKGSSTNEISTKYFLDINDTGDRIESTANYLRDAFEYKGPWIFSAFNLFLNKIAENDTFQDSPLYRQLSMLPAYVKFGVNNPAAAFFSMIGINSREVCIFLSTQFNIENPDRPYDFSIMLDWLLELEAEKIKDWLEIKFGEDKVGYVSRLLRYIDILRNQEQTLIDLLPLEVKIAGWQYYKGSTQIDNLAIGDVLHLKPDPLNPWDSYAVEVLDNSRNKLGYIPRQYSRAVFQHLQNEFFLSCVISAIDQKSTSNPVQIHLEGELET